MILTCLFRQGKVEHQNRTFRESNFSNVPDFESDELIWHKTGLVYLNWDQPIITMDYELDLNGQFDYVRNNQSVYLHSFFYPTGTSSNPDDAKHQRYLQPKNQKEKFKKYL